MTSEHSSSPSPSPHSSSSSPASGSGSESTPGPPEASPEASPEHEHEPYDDGIYQHCFDSFPIPGLCTNFRTAATLLRIARRELRVGLIPDGETVAEDFYSLLQNVEDYMTLRDENKSRNGTDTNNAFGNRRFLIEIEGLDGSGKTTLCRSLTQRMNEILARNSSKNNSSNKNGDRACAIATKTPSACLKKIRPLFDHRGGILARVFYTVSNYVLEYEIHRMSENVRVVVVDRWYASTLAYTVAYKGESDGNAESSPPPDVESMEDSVFCWPRDLKLRPRLLLVLDIDPSVRRSRVAERRGTGGGASLYNPWDDRLDKDPELGRRILSALSRMHNDDSNDDSNNATTTTTLVKRVDANRTAEEVVAQAVAMVEPEYDRFAKSIEPPGADASANANADADGNSPPLEEWVSDARRLNLCDGDGKRCHHALWNLQVAYLEDDDVDSTSTSTSASTTTITTTSTTSTPPVIKTVGLDRIVGDCIYYWTTRTGLAARGSGSGDFSDPPRMASVLWTAGSYPKEFQWRAEGFVTLVTRAECGLLGFRPPNSLVAHAKACHGLARGGDPSAEGDTRTETDDGHRPQRTETYEQAVALARESSKDNDNNNDNDDDNNDNNDIDGNGDTGSHLCMARFVPLRVEVLRGGPSTRGAEGFPNRVEWTRSPPDRSEPRTARTKGADGASADADAGWTRRSILLFTTGVCFGVPTRTRYATVPVCVALTGCHAAGKTTIGEKLASILGWRFDPELGEVLRDRRRLRPGGHRFGDGGESPNRKHHHHNDDDNHNDDNDNDSNKFAWDDLVFDAERRRDEESLASGCCRVVETWHVGNSKWFALRQRNQARGDGDSNASVRRYRDAVSEHRESAVPILVHLDIPSSSVMLDRRTRDESARARLPLGDEATECEEMFRVLQSSENGKVDDAWGIPTLRVDNGDRGEDAINRTIQTILSFVRQHYYKRAVPVQ